MVFESIVGPYEAEHRPWELLILGAIYASLSLVVSYYIFGEDASLVLVFLTTFAASPLLYNALRLEEKKEFFLDGERSILREHARVLSFLMYFFFGTTLAFSLWFIFLPHEATSELFATQLRDITRIEYYSSSVLGMSVASIGTTIGLIILNNMKVLALALVFSLLYGTGALFILTWNASVVATAIGLFVTKQVEGSYLVALPLGFFRYAIHGVPEMLAYFIGGLAGGILSVAIARRDFETKKLKVILKDAGTLAALAVLLLIFAAGVEVIVTPLFFG